MAQGLPLVAHHSQTGGPIQQFPMFIKILNSGDHDPESGDTGKERSQRGVAGPPGPSRTGFHRSVVQIEGIANI